MAPLRGVLRSSLFSNITTFFSSPYATMGLIVIMVLSLTRMTKAMCLALLTLGVMSCTKQNDAPREELVASSTASLSSENTGEKITLDLSATAEDLDLPIAPASEGKALDYQIKNSKKIALKLDENKTEYKLLFILRAVGKAKYTYAVQTWKRNSHNNQLGLREVQITLPENITYAGNNFEAMVFLVPDDFTEQKLVAQNYRFNYQSQKAGATGLISTANGTSFSMDIPYASDWTPLTKRQHQIAGDELSAPIFRLRPLGALMTYTIRNTREKAMSLTGIKVVSNTLVPQATLDLKDTALERIPAGGRLPWTDYGADYADHSYSYDFPVTNLAKGGVSSEALVVWYPTSGAVSRTTFGYNDGTPADPDANVDYPEYTKSQNPEIAARYATTHVYAVGATEDGQAITKPNMSLVPIMGTDLALNGGKSYYMDCEVYTQPNIQLGYMAQQPVSFNQEQNRFYMEPIENLTNYNVTLHHYGNLQEYMHYSYTDPSSVRMKKPFNFNGVEYNIPTDDVMVASGLFRTNAIFFENRFLPSLTRPSVYHNRATYDARGFAPISNGKVQPSRKARVITYSDVQNHVATSILFRHDTLAANVKHPVRSEHQAVYRLTPKNLQDYTLSGKARSTMDYLEVKAVYLGKYFVGDVKDFIPESFWTSPANTANMVVRHYFVPGAYLRLRYSGNSSQTYWQSGYQGSEAAYWMLAASQWQAAPDGKWIASPSIGDVGTYGAELSNWQALDDVWSCRVLQLYSTKYQGDNWK